MSTSSRASAAAALLRATITATASPTWLTSSTAIDGWPGLTMSGVTGQAQGIEPCSSATSRPVRTATTPGASCAALVSIELIFACATGLRTTARCNIPGSTMLSVQVVRPVISRASSLRRRALPTSRSGASVVGRSSTAVIVPPRWRSSARCPTVLCPLLSSRARSRLTDHVRSGRGVDVGRGDVPVGGAAHLTGGLLHRADDVLVAGAAAEVALDALADLVLARVGVVVHQVDRGHDHPGGAEPALQAVHLVERLLHRVQFAVRG